VQSPELGRQRVPRREGLLISAGNRKPTALQTVGIAPWSDCVVQSCYPSIVKKKKALLYLRIACRHSIERGKVLLCSRRSGIDCRSSREVPNTSGRIPSPALSLTCLRVQRHCPLEKHLQFFRWRRLAARFQWLRYSNPGGRSAVFQCPGSHGKKSSPRPSLSRHSVRKYRPVVQNCFRAKKQHQPQAIYVRNYGGRSCALRLQQ